MAAPCRPERSQRKTGPLPGGRPDVRGEDQPAIQYSDDRLFSSLLFTVFGCGQAELSQPGHKVVFSLDAKVPMRDGVHLSADVYRPDAPGPFPTLMLMTAYKQHASRRGEPGRSISPKGAMPRSRWISAAVTTPRGSGTPTSKDPQDGFDTQKWLAEQDWCNGKIGTFRHSYDGFTQVMPARYQHPNLKALMPSANQETNFGHLYNDGIPQLNVIFVGRVPLGQPGHGLLARHFRPSPDGLERDLLAAPPLHRPG